ncbi:hypothetical protein HMPREF9436_01903 [Faecalibacterium cf. prausnitzii KLE1255]|uniref:Uncharacterized protein n=1 Tax=Faecalibacterium cf. prausnitzii KLE1255 TaxID=748224 RepID=E2ZJQ4_9FIRM|nr:hypothetical protein HMPREF9436_01903 [Faecalibacterium cf. prausnitzii KLE1255]
MQNAARLRSVTQVSGSFCQWKFFLPSRNSSSTQPISMLPAVTTKGELLCEAKLAAASR